MPQDETLTSPIQFSDSFQLTDKQGVSHSFTLAGTLEQKDEILRKSVEFIKGAKAKGWAGPSTVTVQGPAQMNGLIGTSEIIMAETLEVTHDKKGKHFNIKGGKYTKFGLPAYGEYLEALGISEDMEPGEYPFKKKVVVQCTKKGDGTSCKAVALAN